ncbi:rod shape-determining protein MreC [Sulfuriferula nivalis]|uniref:Cell shape-determining protein MreC n=1 Tax=Sulfuriferula nivalis TaxID=2675298 RepID=A0A809RM05_9PROT|nr:rod shape-determining protein MreC [Sulfuriferula nivalis]BBO99820.1 rod shape-determining protein MreC [Sulfuriferula nivalis]
MSERHPHITLFPHGISAGARLMIYILLSIAIIIADVRYHALNLFRSSMNSLIYPISEVVQTPYLTYEKVSGFFIKHAQLQQENAALQQRFINYSAALQRYQELEQENQHLRALLGAQSRTPLHTQLAEIIAIPRDPYLRQFTINQGSEQGVQPGTAVIDERGLLGQITQVYSHTSDVTLLINSEQSVPVAVQRTGQRAVLFGTGIDDTVEIRYLPHSTDVRAGDLIITSGIDGVYPSGLAVAKVTQIDLSTSRAFAHIICKPVAAIDRNRQVLIIAPKTTNDKTSNKASDKP